MVHKTGQWMRRFTHGGLQRTHVGGHELAELCECLDGCEVLASLGKYVLHEAAQGAGLNDAHSHDLRRSKEGKGRGG